MFVGLNIRKALILVLSLAAGACSAFQPTDANGPRSNEPLYPIGLSDVGPRLEEASLAWYQLSQRNGITGKTEANLQPYTATIQSLPANLSAPIYLPKVGSQTNPTEEETRESLRRFIVEWQRLIGAEPNQLSLVERTDEANGIKVARYEQRPFRYALRGGFGNVVIRFRPDRQVVSITSNCIPNADRLQAALGGLTPKIKSDEAIEHVRKLPVVTADVSGWKPTFTIPSSAAL